MKNFAVFAGDSHEPQGGWNDFVGDADTCSDAIFDVVLPKCMSRDWWHVVDLKTGKVFHFSGGKMHPDLRAQLKSERKGSAD